MPKRSDHQRQIGTLVGAALHDAVRRLRAAGSPTPRLDAELLLAHLVGRDRTWVLAHPDAPVDRPAFDALVERRAAGEPVAYIRGFKEWHSLRIRTDPRALIPRPETELLADAAATEIETRLATGSVVAWEVGTGSGAVMVALALRFRDALQAARLHLVATDISTDALGLARENLETHGVAHVVTLEYGDLLEPADAALPRPEVVIANLPYVASAEVDARKGSLGYEPRVALDGGVDGLHHLRRLLVTVRHRAAPNASIFLELGVGQVPVIRSLAPADASVSVVADLAGMDRVVRVDLRD